ncbi:MAG: nitrite/sulfite reductase [Deltaproteobacteria bacterium]|nr:nitrite/sulfite reductase [Deltaproteobacteria bacterium]MBN2671002.1 nitrite/sulfite reductase [Deltaproteobacteria bacterium]
MPKKLTFTRRSEDEDIKAAGLFLDFDEMAKKGAMQADDSSIAKWYGIYKSRQPGNHMARIVIPGGVITSAQAKNIAGIAEKYGQGIVNVTTRQALQFHWLKVGNLADMLRELGEYGNSTKHGCGDVTRNVTACPLAETCAYRRLDARAAAVEMAEFLGMCRDLDDLPRKFKINFSGCGADCAQPHINCVGLSGVIHNGVPGYKVVIGGGMGWKPFVAESLFGFVPHNKVKQVCRAVAILFREHGDRFNRAKSRLKFVVHRKGIDFCRTEVISNLHTENVSSDDIIVEPVTDEGVPFSLRPLLDDSPQGTDGQHTVRVIVPKGELSFSTFYRMAELSERYANQRVYTSNRQNLQFQGVAPSDVKALESEIRALGYQTSGSFTLSDIVSCVGTTYCPKAVTQTRALFDIVQRVVGEPRYESIAQSGVINITGCPNSCSPYRIADIGFRGMRIREESGSVEGYEVLLGGSQTAFGQKLGEFKLSDCEEMLRLVLNAFVAVRISDEFLTDCVNRVGLGYFEKAVYGEI